ncbi:uncharacterized protein LOC110008403 isoform X1 [Amborella trichopoda]|uniref:Uncharacterized protein n=2 Tax=Amborella trichopoda TaxID=13333 RepID=U5DAJ9_AMBTC|nr:uncharacterized protein LOC110008403 isoform X1 [Amborella trichopoda]ERN19250.1 hypothetical protein AMTR_s00061p00209430 [Amborella trichopoda]|eukprot:XP_020531124.1 uncharacterized protein LOC110008403 isoform X1 [Amborella trichopoda]
MDSLKPVFIDSNLGTHLAIIVSPNDSVGNLKRILREEHPLSFPNLGEIMVQALMVKRKSYFYHLPDSLPIKSALEGLRGSWFLFMDAILMELPEVSKGNVISDTVRGTLHDMGKSNVTVQFHESNVSEKSEKHSALRNQKAGKRPRHQHNGEHVQIEGNNVLLCKRLDNTRKRRKNENKRCASMELETIVATPSRCCDSLVINGENRSSILEESSNKVVNFESTYFTSPTVNSQSRLDSIDYSQNSIQNNYHGNHRSVLEKQGRFKQGLKVCSCGESNYEDTTAEKRDISEASSASTSGKISVSGIINKYFPCSEEYMGGSHKKACGVSLSEKSTDRKWGFYSTQSLQNCPLSTVKCKGGLKSLEREPGKSDVGKRLLLATNGMVASSKYSPIRKFRVLLGQL